MAVEDGPGPPGDLSPETVTAALPGRPVRAYPALLSTEADALAWARAGAPAGAVVVADYQASPRGRGGLPWTVAPDRGLGFSMIVRPGLPAEAQGWVFIAASAALAELAGPATTAAWPDEIHDPHGERLGAVGAQTALMPAGVEWAVLSVLLERASPPRAPQLAAAVNAIEAMLAAPAGEVLARYRPRCTTIGRRVRARLLPLGPASTTIIGTATDVRPDGGLVIDTDDGRRAVVPPFDLGVLEPA